jgi:DNA modification methylase
MIRLLSGDCRDVLATLPDASVQCCVTSPPYYALRSYLAASHADKHREMGSEATPDAYIATMVGVFREVRRVLRDDGTCWVNMGDSYAGSWGNQGRKQERGTQRAINGPMMQVVDDGRYPDVGSNTGKVPQGYKPKDLLMMPARLALALQADGWWLRSDIIWAKPNPMPESCWDRPTNAHEHVFLLTKRARYYYDTDAVREERVDIEDARTFRGGCYVNGTPGKRAILGNDYVSLNSGRNLRNVWTLSTESFSGAHFATFPTALAERCIKAGTSERGCCAACGAPWVRITEKGPPDKETTRGLQMWTAETGQRDSAGGLPHRETTTTDWLPSCACDAATVPCTVLDPFAGAGTTLLVADRLQRHAIGIDLNSAYTELTMERMRADAPLLVDIDTGPAPEHPEEQAMADLFAEAAE